MRPPGRNCSTKAYLQHPWTKGEDITLITLVSLPGCAGFFMFWLMTSPPFHLASTRQGLGPLPWRQKPWACPRAVHNTKFTIALYALHLLASPVLKGIIVARPAILVFVNEIAAKSL